MEYVKGSSKLSAVFGMLLVAVVTLAVGCSEKGPAEKAGAKIDAAVENAKEKAGEAMEEAGEKVEEAGDEIRDATDH